MNTFEERKDNVVIDGTRDSRAASLTEDELQLAKYGKAEELKREWGFWSILGFATTNLCGWEVSSTLLGAAFLNGGAVAIVYSLLASCLGVFFIDASLAEIASICPIAGAQYYWVAHFAPEKIRPIASFIQGWTTTLSWQSSVIFFHYFVASQIQALVIFTVPTYEPHSWHLFLMIICVSLVNCTVNTIGKSWLPYIETVSGVCHVVFFFATIITLLVLGKKNDTSFVWTNFQNNGGWVNNGISFCLGFLGPTTALAGADGCVHMSEECKRANLQIPRAMIGSLLINGTIAFAYVVVVLYCITDLDSALMSPTGYPIIEIYYQATGSKAVAVVLECFIIIIQMASVFCQLASTSRLTWAFARDKGLPFSEFFAKVHPTIKAPIRAVFLNFAISLAISTIVLGSVVGLYAITSFGVTTLFLSYSFAITAFLYYRLSSARRGVTIPYGPWRLGKAAIPCNILGIAFCVFVFVLLPFPTMLPVTPQNMNWAGPILGFLLLLGLLDWAVRGRKQFKAPVIDMTVLSQGGTREQALLRAAVG